MTCGTTAFEVAGRGDRGGLAVEKSLIGCDIALRRVSKSAAPLPPGERCAPNHENPIKKTEIQGKTTQFNSVQMRCLQGSYPPRAVQDRKPRAPSGELLPYCGLSLRVARSPRQSRYILPLFEVSHHAQFHWRASTHCGTRRRRDGVANAQRRGLLPSLRLQTAKCSAPLAGRTTRADAAQRPAAVPSSDGRRGASRLPAPCKKTRATQRQSTRRLRKRKRRQTSKTHVRRAEEKEKHGPKRDPNRGPDPSGIGARVVPSWGVRQRQLLAASLATLSVLAFQPYTMQGTTRDERSQTFKSMFRT